MFGGAGGRVRRVGSLSADAQTSIFPTSTILCAQTLKDFSANPGFIWPEFQADQESDLPGNPLGFSLDRQGMPAPHAAG
jgi:hypothetical protein